MRGNVYLFLPFTMIGGVAEWPMAAVLKTVVPKGTVGSNPTSSAMNQMVHVPVSINNT